MTVEFTYDDVADTVAINRYGVITVFDLTQVAGNGFNATRLGKIRDAVQENILENRVLRDSLDADDPARLADPATQHGEKFFWFDDNGTIWVVSREYILTEVQWDGNALIPIYRKAVGV